MKKQIFILILSIMFILIGSLAMSQDREDLKNSTPEERAQFQTEWMMTELSLDSAIVPVVYKINLKYSRENQSLAKSGGSRLQKYRELKANSSAKDKELKGILSKEQYKLYLEKKEQMKSNIKKRIQEKRSGR